MSTLIWMSLNVELLFRVKVTPARSSEWILSECENFENFQNRGIHLYVLANL
mgnify:CR=1 FL=1